MVSWTKSPRYGSSPSTDVIDGDHHPVENDYGEMPVWGAHKRVILRRGGDEAREPAIANNVR